MDSRTRNHALVRHLLLPTIFLTVALLGGVRVSAGTGALLFLAPPLVTLLLALMLLALFARGHLIEFGRWLDADNHALVNISHALTLATLFFASAQSFNSVLPEAGLLRWVFSFFFLWTLWQNQFSSFDARRLVRSLAALFGTAFVLKHMLLASLAAPDGGWLKRLAGALVEGVTLGTLNSAQAFAPATGYISFFTLALYVGGLLLLPPSPANDLRAAELDSEFKPTHQQLSAPERASLQRVSMAEREMRADADEQPNRQLSGVLDGVAEIKGVPEDAGDFDDGDE